MGARRPRVAFALSVPRASAAAERTSSVSAERPAKVRVQQLRLRASVRLGEIRAQEAERALESLAHASEQEVAERVSVLTQNLEKEIRTLRKVAHPSADTVANNLEFILQRLENSYGADTIYDGELKDTPSEDVIEWTDSDDARPTSVNVVQASDTPAATIVDNVRQKVVRQRDALRRTASNVKHGVGEKVAEFVNEDGSIDFNGLRTIVRETLDSANGLWQRLNGRVPKDQPEEQSEMQESVTTQSTLLSLRDEEKQFMLREEIGELEKQLNEASKARENVLRKEDQLGKLIRAKEIRAMDDNVSAVRRTLAVRVLQLEMEKIFASLAEEIESSSYDTMMDQRLMVAEFGELDERLAEMEVFVDSGEPVLVQDDALGDVASDIQYLKTRLGLDAQLYSSATLDWPQVRQFIAASAKKTKAGFEFYARGIRLFIGDLQYAFRLIRRAVLGYTPTPREVRTLRRTGRDFLTLIPFTIILIAPLTPVGHVLVFSFLQRYWPDFFPSTFSERRQALMKRYEMYAQSLREDGEDVKITGDRIQTLGDMDRGTAAGNGVARRLPFFGAWIRKDEQQLQQSSAVGDSTRDGDQTPNYVGVDGKNRVEGGDSTPAYVSPSGGATGVAEGASRNGSTTVRDENRSTGPSVEADIPVVRKDRGGFAIDELHLAD